MLLAASSLIGVAIAETGLWLLELGDHRDQLERAFEQAELPPAGAEVTLGAMLRPSSHPHIVYELKPELDVRFHDSRVETNPLGWREESFAKSKVPGEIRVIGIGDSFMFGWAVEERERYLDVLEAELRVHRPGYQWNTLAFAVPGYNLVMEGALLEHYGLSYQPDLILYGFTGNDLCLPNFVGRPAPRFASHSRILERLRGATKIGVRARLRARDEVLEGVAADADFSTRFCTESSVAPEYRGLVGRANFERALFEMVALGAQLEVPVVMFSHAWSGSYDASRLPEGLILLDSVEEFARHLAASPDPDVDPRDSDLVVSPRDPHPSPLAHGIIGRSIYRQLDEAGLWDQIERSVDGGGPEPVAYSR